MNEETEIKITIILLLIAMMLAIVYVTTLPTETTIVQDKYTQQIMSYQLKNDNIVIRPVTYYCLNTIDGEKIVNREVWEKISIGDNVVKG